jgi:hypothetical protein
MTALLYSSNLTAAQALETNRNISTVFIRRKTTCVGCYLASFCTLEDVARTYRFPLDEFLGELERAAYSNKPSLIGAQNG